MIKRNIGKLIIYELNEVPIKVLKKFISDNPRSNISYLCNKGFLRTTFTTDEGELHPWSTWPTVHRGVNNNVHQIKFINQSLNCSKNWPPIWEELIKNKISVGIFGSLQSYPPIKNDLVKFYLPDTFAPSSDAIPKKIQDFQDFNLKLTSQNKAISRAINLKDYIKFLKLFIKGNFKIKSTFKVFLHIFSEIINKKNKSLRSLMQPILGFDIYLKLLKNQKPDFSTFFTNHVAGVMHRYWKYTFPEDFDDSTITKNNFHNNSIAKAMQIADDQIGELIKFCDKTNYELWIISSMGQEAIKRDNDFPEIFVGDINKILKAVELNPKNYKLLPAMQPDLCISCKDDFSLTQLSEKIKNIRDGNGNIIFSPRYRNDGNALNISIKHSFIAYRDRKFYVKEKVLNDNELNIEFIKRDIGTGYHCKEGIYIGYGKRTDLLFKSYDPGEIDTRDFFIKVKEFFDVKSNFNYENE